MTKHELQDIKKGWQDDDTADSYDDVRFTTLFGKISDALDKVAIKKGLYKTSTNGLILDLPCGTGRIMEHLYRVGYENIIGADISEQMIKVAKNKMLGKNKASFVRTEADRTEFPDGTFDAISSIRFMGHIPRGHRVKILSEFGRICRGPIIVEYSVRNPIARRIKGLLRVLTVRGRLPSQWKWHDVSHDELELELKEAGLHVANLINKLPFLSESIFVVAKRSELKN